MSSWEEVTDRKIDSIVKCYESGEDSAALYVEDMAYGQTTLHDDVFSEGRYALKHRQPVIGSGTRELYRFRDEDAAIRDMEDIIDDLEERRED